MSSESATVVYWSLNARATAAATVAALGGVNLTWDSDLANTWPAPKGQAPFGQLPILKVGDNTFAQSAALVRILAKLGKVQGDDVRSFGISEMITEEAVDIFSGMAKSKYAADSAAEYTKYFTEYLPAQYAYLDKLISDDGFFAGAQALQGDAALWAALYLVERCNAGLAATALATAPKLTAWKARFEAIDSIQALKPTLDARGAYFEFKQE